MISLPIPLLDTSVETIFKECVNRFESDESKKRLLTYSTAVTKYSQQFLERMPSEIGMIVFPRISKKETKEIKKVYTQKFANQEEKSLREKYYNVIMANAPGRKCPICEISITTTLDHYLPKSKYPLLVVTPANLIPTCWNCNLKKGTFSSVEAEDMPLHPYFDDVSKIKWLDAKVSFNSGLIIEYINGCGSDVYEVMKKRIDIHLRVNQLKERYALLANGAIDGSKLYWKDIYFNSGKEQLLLHFNEQKKSEESFDLNSWKSAMYRALTEQYNEVEMWIQSL
ncbi:MAG: HNH endonuclease [Lachnospiraceae bacterium]|nr:HNH endonuclease [Lachnospiraceae bacterium]